jgi:hypothetical protein
MNIEPNRKIESSFRLESKGSWGSGIMEVIAQAGKLKDSVVRSRFDAVLIARIRELSSIPLLTR